MCSTWARHGIIRNGSPNDSLLTSDQISSQIKSAAMFKLYIVLALAVAGASAQLAPQPNSEAAPEPYSYGYETDSHSAAEQRDPSGKVTGFYTISDADGRQRRVEYIADEGGFRAKVATNEVGTKNENSADVEMQASPPTEAQYAPVARVQQQSQYVQAAPQVVRQQAAPVRSQAISYQVQPSTAGYGYYGYNSGQYGGQYAYPAGYGYGYGYQPYGYGGAYTTTATSAAPIGYGYTTGYNTGSVGNYNNHLPSQYYASVQQAGGAPAGGVRYVTQTNPALTGYQSQGSYRSYSSSVGAAQPATGGQLTGSSNYIVLKKRNVEQKAEQKK